MKNCIVLVIIFLTSLFLTSCKEKTKENSVNNGSFVVNVDTLKTEDINMSSYFKCATPIILETNEDCLIKNIGNIQVIDSFIFILDREQEMLFSFDNKGKFIRKIGNKGAGPGEYEELSDFTINTREKKIYLFDGFSLKCFVYDINGKYISSQNFDIKLNGHSNQIQYVNEDMFIDYAPSNMSKEDNTLLCKINSITGSVEGCYLSANENNMGFKQLATNNDGAFHFRTSEKPIYIPLYSNIVYSLTKDGAFPYVTLLSKNIMTKEELADFDMSDPMTQIKIEQSPKILRIPWYCETANFIFITFKKEKCFNLVISKIDKSVKMCNFLTDDIACKKDHNYIPYCPYFSDEKGMYTVIGYHFMPMFIDIVKSGETNLSPEQVDKISKLTEDANPVLFYYECK